MENDSIGKRLRRWRSTSKLKLIGLSEKINVAASSLSELENDKSLPSSETLVKLYNETDLDIIWLLTGNGRMFRQGKDENGGTGFYEDILPQNKDERLREMLKKFIRVYNGNQEKAALLRGFLEGADPQN